MVASLNLVLGEALVEATRTVTPGGHLGGGIVVDSEPEAEYLETLDKAQALITALPERT